MTESDDDELQLRAETLIALQEFLQEKQDQEDRLKLLSKHSQVTDVAFDENWQLSQFWYDDETVNSIVNGAINSTPLEGKIALISCPTLYGKLKKNASGRQITLFEYDERFNVYGNDFVMYDYKLPLNIPRDMSSQFDLVIADPPFLSDECLTKTAVTIKFLSKKNIILCTGAVMQDLAERLLDVKKCNFTPHHKNNLANEFSCYANFDFDEALISSA